MAERDDMLRRYLDAGVAFTQMTRERAEEFVKQLIEAGEVRRSERRQRVDELLERSRQNTEALVDQVRNQIMDQLGAMGIATKDDIARLEARIGQRSASAPAAADTAKKAPAPKKASAKKSAPAKKAAPPAEAVKKGP